MTASTFGGLVE